MFYVYLLRSKNQHYIGYTTDLKRRITEHNAGQNIATIAYRPWDLIFYEAYVNREDARRREKYLKTTQGRRTIKLMLRSYYLNHED